MPTGAVTPTVVLASLVAARIVTRARVVTRVVGAGAPAARAMALAAVTVVIVAIGAPAAVAALPVARDAAVVVDPAGARATVDSAVAAAVPPVPEVPKVVQRRMSAPAAPVDGDRLDSVALQGVVSFVRPAQRDWRREGGADRLNLNVGVAIEPVLLQGHLNPVRQGALGNLERQPALEAHHPTLSAEHRRRAPGPTARQHSRER